MAWPNRLEPLVRRVLAGNPSAFTFTGTQSYLVGAGEGVAVIDPGPDEPDHIDALVAAIGGARVDAICLHPHPPRPLARRRAAGRRGPAAGSSAAHRSRSRTTARARMRRFDPSYTPDRVLEDGESLSRPRLDADRRRDAGPHLEPPVLCAGGSGALFTGDHVMGWSTTVVSPPDGDMADYMASLAKLHDREDRVYYPAHGPAVNKPRQLVRGMIGHRRQRESQILRLLGQGVGVIEDMVPQMYKGVDQRLWPAAGRSVLAHLIDLARQRPRHARRERWNLAA